MKTGLKVGLIALAVVYVVFFLAYLGYSFYTSGPEFLATTRGYFLGAFFSFLSAIGFYYFTKYIERMGKSINCLVDLERSLMHNQNVLPVNIGQMERAQSAFADLTRYRFHLKPLIDIRDKHNGLVNLDVIQTVTELSTEIVWLNDAFSNAPHWADEIFIDRIQHGMPDDALRDNLADLSEEMSELVKACRKHQADTLEAMVWIKAALENERTIFGEIVKQRFGKKDVDRKNRIRARLKKEMEESREENRQRMREYGIEPEEEESGGED